VCARQCTHAHGPQHTCAHPRSYHGASASALSLASVMRDFMFVKLHILATLVWTRTYSDLIRSKLFVLIITIILGLFGVLVR